MNIPPKRNRKDPICFSPYLYRARSLIERFFNKFKQCRRVATPFDKLAANYPASVRFASIRLWLGAHESTPYAELPTCLQGQLVVKEAGQTSIVVATIRKGTAFLVRYALFESSDSGSVP